MKSLNIFFSNKNFQKFFNSIFLIGFFFLLNNFGFNETNLKSSYLVLFGFYLFCTFIKYGYYLFFIINIAFFIYMRIYSEYDFSLFFFQILFLSLYISDKELVLLSSKYSKFELNGILQLVSFAIIFIFTLLSQNSFLQYEILDHDTSTLLLISQEFFDGFLPYERQWDDKQPLFYFFSYIILLITNTNFLLFKVVFDIFTFLNAFVIYLFVFRKLRKSFIISITSSLLYLLISSQPWANSEYSEIMSLTFLSIGFYLSFSKRNKYIFYLVGFFFSLSTLINIGSGIFIVGFLFSIYLNFKKNYKEAFFKFFLGFGIPHLLITMTYSLNGLFGVYLTTILKIPISYTTTDSYFFYDLRVFIESIFKTNIFLCLLFLISFFNILNIFFKLASNSFKDGIKFSVILFVFCSLLFFYLANKGYYHHLIYLIFFVSISLSLVSSSNLKAVLFCSFLLVLFSHFPNYATNSYFNLSNHNQIYEEYPIRNLSENLMKDFNKNDLSILALDNLLILFYLQQNNDIYIVHPTNHNEYFIVDNFINENIINVNYIEQSLQNNVDLVICSTNKDKDLYYEINSQNFMCTQSFLIGARDLEISQDIFENSEYYYNSNKISKIFKINNN